jgi:hypothetical protein
MRTCGQGQPRPEELFAGSSCEDAAREYVFSVFLAGTKRPCGVLPGVPQRRTPKSGSKDITDLVQNQSTFQKTVFSDLVDSTRACSVEGGLKPLG